MKLLHTSDIHLEAKMAFLGDKAADYRAQILETFESLVEVTQANQVQIVAISGDLFDSSNPSDFVVQVVQKVFKSLLEKGIYVAVIPGNHDYLKPSSIYVSDELDIKSDKYILFNQSGEQKRVIDELKLVLYAKPNDQSKSTASPLPVKDNSNEYKDYKHVALVHGSYDVKGEKAENYPVTREKIEQSGFDYVALGDWHSYFDTGLQSPRAVYPGSIEPLRLDQYGAGSVVITDFGAEQVKVDTYKVGKFQAVKLGIDLNSQNLLREIENQINKVVEEKTVEMSNLLVDLELVGQKQIGMVVSSEELEEYFLRKVFFFKINDKSTLVINEDVLKAYPAHTMIGKFIEILNTRKDIDPKLREKAIQIGVNLLRQPG